MKRRTANRSAPLVTITRRTNILRIPRKRILGLIQYIARTQKANIGEVDVAVVDDDEMTSLNRTYHHVAGTTDVLSFNLADPNEPICAQIIVCASEAVRQSRYFGHSPRQELLVYVTHGLLHLLGHDDATPAGAQEMSRTQDALLAIRKMK